MSAVVRASITVTPGIPIMAATILSGSVSTTRGYVRVFLPPWIPKRRFSTRAGRSTSDTSAACQQARRRTDGPGKVDAERPSLKEVDNVPFDVEAFLGETGREYPSGRSVGHVRCCEGLESSAASRPRNNDRGCGYLRAFHVQPAGPPEHGAIECQGYLVPSRLCISGREGALPGQWRAHRELSQRRATKTYSWLFSSNGSRAKPP